MNFLSKVSSRDLNTSLLNRFTPLFIVRSKKYWIIIIIIIKIKNCWIKIWQNTFLRINDFKRRSRWNKIKRLKKKSLFSRWIIWFFFFFDFFFAYIGRNDKPTSTNPRRDGSSLEFHFWKRSGSARSCLPDKFNGCCFTIKKGENENWIDEGHGWQLNHLMSKLGNTLCSDMIESSFKFF